MDHVGICIPPASFHVRTRLVNHVAREVAGLMTCSGWDQTVLLYSSDGHQTQSKGLKSSRV